jgi:curved DNA-binding protein CbpA
LSVKNLNPYEELGLRTDASVDEVKAAYRKRAKEVHPDANPGDAEAPEKLHRATTAMSVLLDPARRSKYDRTGTIDEEQPDNSRAGALQLIEAFIEKKVADYINGNFAPTLDPRRGDMVQEFRDQMNAEISNAAAALIQWDKAKRFLKDMAKRFRGKKPNGPIERAFQARLARTEESVRQLKEAGEVRRVAITIVAEYEFEWDRPSTMQGWSITGAG